MRTLKVILTVAMTVAAVMMLMSCERKVTNEITNVVAEESAKYVGSDECQPCHSDIHGDFIKSGHPFKLNKAALAQQPGYYPFGDLAGPPANTVQVPVDIFIVQRPGNTVDIETEQTEKITDDLEIGVMGGHQQ